MDRGLQLQPRRQPYDLSPVRPSGGSAKERFSGKEEVEDACRIFESYFVEMIVEGGNLRDLMDIEELLYCWKNIKCPVFIDLVSRFYGELCRDLFSAEGEDCITTSSFE